MQIFFLGGGRISFGDRIFFPGVLTRKKYQVSSRNSLCKLISIVRYGAIDMVSCYTVLCLQKMVVGVKLHLPNIILIPFFLSHLKNRKNGSDLNLKLAKNPKKSLLLLDEATANQQREFLGGLSNHRSNLVKMYIFNKQKRS